MLLLQIVIKQVLLNFIIGEVQTFIHVQIDHMVAILGSENRVKNDLRFKVVSKGKDVHVLDLF